jgi:hypothetical protein
MNNLNPAIFIVPLIALLLTVIMFISLLRKADDKAAFKRYVLITLVLSFLLNLAWEVVQLPLYKNASFNIQHIAFCGLASVADAIMVLLIYFVLAQIYKDPIWIRHLNLKRTLIIVLIGATGAVLAEMRHLSQGNWAYASSMPIIPFLNIGLSPVLQFMFTPVLSYYLSFYFLKKNYGSQTD